jgi:hypothetical protein
MAQNGQISSAVGSRHHAQGRQGMARMAFCKAYE